MRFGGNILNRRGPIGVAIAQRAVYLAQRGSDGTYTFACQDLPKGGETSGPVFHADTGRAIASAFKRGKFSGKFAVSALPAATLRYKTLRLPPMPDEDLEQAVAWEAAERFQTTESDALQHYRAGQVQQGDEQREEIIVLAADGAMIYDHASAVKNAGLVPIAVEATGAALARVLGEEDKSTLIIDLNHRQAEVVACRAGHVIFDKLIDLTMDQSEVDAEALARELSLCLRYLSVTFGVHQPEAIWLGGEHATPILAEALGDAIHQPIRLIAASPTAKQLDLPSGDASAWLVAAGLSLRDESGQAQRGAA